MRRALLTILIMTLLVAACAAPNSNPISSTAGSLLVSAGTTEKTYSMEDLIALGTVQATFRDVTYVGVPLALLLQDAGFDPTAVQAVKAVAADGFSANYDPELVNKPDTLVAYARAEGPLADDEGPFLMVLPDQDGKLNVRQVTQIQIIP